MALTGFLVNMGDGNSSVCADGSANAILAIGARFPYVAGSQPFLCSLVTSVFTAPNTFTNSITCHDLSSAQVYSYSHPLTLMQCDPVTYPYGFQSHTQQEWVDAGIVIFTALLSMWGVLYGKRKICQFLDWARNEE